MKKYDSNNERIKRKYFSFLKEAKGHNERTVDAVAKALNRFEVYTKFKDFKRFHINQAKAFKYHLADQKGKMSGKKLSKSTLHTTLTQLKRFFKWLAREQGYKSRIHYSDAEYFNLSEKDTKIATAKRPQKFPTMEQIKHVIDNMPVSTEIECRNRALIAFTILTGARISAIASMKLKHIDMDAGCVYQDAMEVQTKFSKTFTTYFFPVDAEIHRIFKEWVSYLRDEMWGNDDPLFPKTKMAQGGNRKFEVSGLAKEHWITTTPLRKIFGEAFIGAGLPYFNPHSFRKTLTQFGEKACKTTEHFKAWSQNLGHEKVMTTLINYGEVTCQRQGEIIHELAMPKEKMKTEANIITEGVLEGLRLAGLGV